MKGGYIALGWTLSVQNMTELCMERELSFISSPEPAKDYQAAPGSAEIYNHMYCMYTPYVECR